MKSRKKQVLTKAELRAMGATPGFMAHKVGADGRARLEQLAPESHERRKDFIRRLTRSDDNTPASEEA
jgi:hypothetical protein